METLRKQTEAAAFLEKHSTGVLSTISGENTPRARLVYYTSDDAFNIYFMTLANTRKASDLAIHPQAAFVVSETEIPQTLQIEGTITDLTETATIDTTLSNLVETLMSNQKYGAPINRFDPGILKLYRLTPTWIRWGNFTFGQGTDQVFTEIK